MGTGWGEAVPSKGRQEACRMVLEIGEAIAATPGLVLLSHKVPKGTVIRPRASGLQAGWTGQDGGVKVS